MALTLNAVYLKVPEGYIGFVEELPGANTQGETPEEARINVLMDEIVASQDAEARKRAYEEVETIVNQQAWFIWLPIANQKLPVSNRFGNVQPSILSHRILWNVESVYVK